MSHAVAVDLHRHSSAENPPPDGPEWGPIDGPTAERLGLSSEVESRLIRPAAPEVARAAEAVLELVPKSVLPVEGDTAESLVARLERSDWLDGMQVKEGGHGKGGSYVLLNSEDYPQPRRKSWSVLLKEELEDDDGDHVHWLLAYKVPAKASSWHCTVTAPTHAHAHTHISHAHSALRLRGGALAHSRPWNGSALMPWRDGAERAQALRMPCRSSAGGKQPLRVCGCSRCRRARARDRQSKGMLGYARPLQGGDQPGPEASDLTEHDLSHRGWLHFVNQQRLHVFSLVRLIFTSKNFHVEVSLRRQITAYIVPFQKRPSAPGHYIVPPLQSDRQFDVQIRLGYKHSRDKHPG